jgi:excisionase family DNA binding protein
MTRSGPLDTRESLLSPAQVAERVGVDRSTVYRALEEGELRGFKVGTGPKAPWRCRLEDVEAWLGAAA